MVKNLLVIHITIFCFALNLAGCIFQDEGVTISCGDSMERGADILLATDEYLYGVYGEVYCLNWKGEIIWETPNLGSRGMIKFEKGILAKLYCRETGIGGVAFVTLEGKILWQKELELISSTGLGASNNMLVAGSTNGTLWAFSPSGEALWTYDHDGAIEQLVVAPDDSCVIFCDDYNINCVANGIVCWSEYTGRISTYENKRTLAFSPDSSYFIHESRIDGPRIVAKTPDGEELWSFPLENRLRSVAITDDSNFVIAGCTGYLYKFTSEGTLVWKSKVGADNQYLAITPDAQCIVIGAVSPFSRMIVINAEGKPLWRTRSIDNIFAVVISPDGKKVAFSNRLDNLYLFSNPPEELQ